MTIARPTALPTCSSDPADNADTPDLLQFLAMVMDVIRKTGSRIPSTKENILAERLAGAGNDGKRLMRPN